MNPPLVLTDLGTFKAYRLEKTEDAPTQRAEPGMDVEGRNKKAGSPR